MRYIAVAAFLLAAACQTSPQDGPRVSRGDKCGAGGYESLIGRNRSVFAAMTFPQGTRIIFPGMPVTLDYNPERLNFDIGADDRITRVWCG